MSEKEIYLEWTCPRCKTAYALELYSPKPHVCLHNVSQNKGRLLQCGQPFPNQEIRNIMKIHQLEVIT